MLLGGMVNKGETIRFNVIDFMHLAYNEVFLSNGILITIRFKENHAISEIRTAMRYMLSIYPKLRSIVEPTLFAYLKRILDDSDARIDILFNHNFRVFQEIRYDSQAFLSIRRDLYNEPFAIQGNIPVKMCYFPDDPHPVLLVSFHHMVADAISWIHMLGSMMSYLNGIKPSFVPLDKPSLIPALLEDRISKIPQQIIQAYRSVSAIGKRHTGEIVVPASLCKLDFVGPQDVHHQTLKHALSPIKSKSKTLGCSINTFLLTAVALTMNRFTGKAHGDVIAIGQPIDLRPYFPDKRPVFGNYLTGVDVRVPRQYGDNPRLMLDEINVQMTDYKDLIRQKQMIFLPGILKILTIIGKKNFTRILRDLMRKGYIKRTCGFTNIGNIDHLNSYGTQAQILDAISCAPSQGLLIVINSIEDQINAKISFRESEFSRQDILTLVNNLEQAIDELLNL